MSGELTSTLALNIYRKEIAKEKEPKGFLLCHAFSKPNLTAFPLPFALHSESAGPHREQRAAFAAAIPPFTPCGLLPAYL